tara:strand:- start:228 stop:833 length:606 start_codon:yes stop_codon:yes gene_type:complete
MLAKLFSKIQSPIEFSLGGEVMHLMLTLPFSWKLFFFSALVFTIGAILYNLIAPSIIKENMSFGEFLIDRKNHSHIVMYREELGISEEKIKSWGIDVNALLSTQITFGSEIGGLKFTFYEEQWKNKIAEDKMEIFKLSERNLKNKNLTKDDQLESAFWVIYNYAIQCRKTLLVITALFYLAGFIMITIVFIQSVIEVIKWV